MTTVTSKKEMLESAGYRYNFNRMIYFNQAARKVFSVEAIDDNSEQWLHDRIAEKNGERGWRFYFNAPPSETVRQKLLSEIG